MKRIYILVTVFCFFAVEVNAQPDVSVYVQADADDWQLFMSKKVSGDLELGNKVIMITLTAGDEGYGNGTFNAAPIPYYLAKERGAVYSSKTVADFSYTAFYPFSFAVPTVQTQLISGKNLVKYSYGHVSGVGNVVNYFLRLPDGGPLGNGFPATLNKSLMKLQQGSIPNITSVDNANTYTWSELVNTIFDIILTERGTDPQFYLNTSSLNIIDNPDDHSDHIYSSTAAQEAVLPYLSIGINEFVFDYSSVLANNLANGDYENSAAVFSTYNWSMILNKYPSMFNSTIRAWLHKEYFNVKRTPLGALPVSLLDFTGTLKENRVLLEWSTSAEFNSKEFKIEKSVDGVNYYLLNAVPAAGNSTSTKNYTYMDNNAAEINYYRLKMVDINGSFKQSNVVIIKNPKLQQSIVSVTNPFKDNINIQFAKLPKGEIALKLVDMAGRQVFVSKIINPISSLVHVEMNNKPVSNGIYILYIENEGKRYSFKLMKD
ncbi:MAG: T9SS type A sorting domain-containing protein [Ferruginibacter sp.]